MFCYSLVTTPRANKDTLVKVTTYILVDCQRNDSTICSASLVAGFPGLLSGASLSICAPTCTGQFLLTRLPTALKHQIYNFHKVAALVADVLYAGTIQRLAAVICVCVCVYVYVFMYLWDIKAVPGVY